MLLTFYVLNFKSEVQVWSFSYIHVKLCEKLVGFSFILFIICNIRPAYSITTARAPVYVHLTLHSQLTDVCASSYPEPTFAV